MPPNIDLSAFRGMQSVRSTIGIEVFGLKGAKRGLRFSEMARSLLTPVYQEVGLVANSSQQGAKTIVPNGAFRWSPEFARGRLR